MKKDLVIEVCELSNAPWLSCDLPGFDWAWRVLSDKTILIQGCVVGTKSQALKQAQRCKTRLSGLLSGKSLGGFDNNIHVVEPI